MTEGPAVSADVVSRYLQILDKFTKRTFIYLIFLFCILFLLFLFLLSSRALCRCVPMFRTPPPALAVHIVGPAGRAAGLLCWARRRLSPLMGMRSCRHPLFVRPPPTSPLRAPTAGSPAVRARRQSPMLGAPPPISSTGCAPPADARAAAGIPSARARR
jgi:hypothetical protein